MSTRGILCVLEHLTTALDDQGRRVATVGDAAQHIAVWLAWHTNSDGRPSWAAQATIAREAGKSRATVNRKCAELAAAKVIEVEQHAGKHGTNRVRVVLCLSCRTELQKEGEGQGGGGRDGLSVAQSYRGGSTELQPPVAPRDRNTGREHRTRTPVPPRGESFVPLIATTLEPDKASETNERAAPAKPAYTPPGTWTPEKRAAWIAWRVDEIRRDPRQGPKAAAAFLAKITAEDLSLERARLQSGDSPPGYRGFGADRVAELKRSERTADPPHISGPADPEPCADCPEEATG